MKKLISSVIPSLLAATIIAAVGFTFSMKVSQAIAEEKINSVKEKLQMIIDRLDRIENKIDRGI